MSLRTSSSPPLSPPPATYSRPLARHLSGTPVTGLSGDAAAGLRPADNAPPGLRPAHSVDVVAHRGGHSGAAENSLAAFSNAASMGVDMLELDVRRTADGVLVVHHDERVYPGAPNRGSGPRVGELPYQALPPLADGQPMARLADVADLARERKVPLLVELKETGYERQVLDELGSRLPIEQYSLMSFHGRAVSAIERLQPATFTGLLSPETALHTIARRMTSRRDPIARAKAVRADFVGLYHRGATPHMLNRAAKAGMPVAVWTVNTPGRMRELLHDPRVGALITDQPDVALRLRGAVGDDTAVTGSPIEPQSAGAALVGGETTLAA